ncbi:MAG: hypothetical protein AAF333_14725 [Planctomycetota bacterium]
MRQRIRDIIDAMWRDKKQAGMIVGLAAVGLLLWGRLLLKQVPQTASADGKPQWLVEVEAEAAAPMADKTRVALPRPDKPARDLFLLDPSGYQKALSEDSGLSEAKLVEEVTDEERRMAVVEAAAGLRLQSITLGDVPAAFINGRLIRVGRSIEGFVLLSCDERSAVLEKDGFKVRLGMGSGRPRNR